MQVMIVDNMINIEILNQPSPRNFILKILEFPGSKIC